VAWRVAQRACCHEGACATRRTLCMRAACVRETPDADACIAALLRRRCCRSGWRHSCVTAAALLAAEEAAAWHTAALLRRKRCGARRSWRRHAAECDAHARGRGVCAPRWLLRACAQRASVCAACAAAPAPLASALALRAPDTRCAAMWWCRRVCVSAIDKRASKYDGCARARGRASARVQCSVMGAPYSSACRILACAASALV
jgi:hypothetical protein